MIGRPQTPHTTLSLSRRHTTFSLLPLCGACPPALTQSIIPSLSLRLFPTPSSAPSPRSRSHHHHPQPPPPPPLPRPGPGRGAGSAAARRGALGRGGWSYLCVRVRGRRGRWCHGAPRAGHAPDAAGSRARRPGPAVIRPDSAGRLGSRRCLGVGFPAPIRRPLGGSAGRVGARRRGR
ncbi:hypothetical protein PVAP13_2NG175112 [Panicum virgatum]|uniref:Uncharacterized protein n=1 Tax=Panicum virgatum TaxID=38727 RepID=A0A8T0VIP5_PANVG|nr:hypothetical protein PVAP13_2NG175112 [Panicum virgatum]